MGSNIFSGGDEQKKQAEFKEKVDVHSKAILTVVERQKNLESSFDLVNEKIELLDHNSIKQFKKFNTDLKSLREDIRNIKHDIVHIKEFNLKISKQFRLVSTKDEVQKLEKYIDLWNPMDFVTRQELDDYREKMKSDFEKIIKGFLK